MECRCRSCELHAPVWAYQDMAMPTRPTTPELSKGIEDLAIELSTHTEEKVSASYAIFYNSLTYRLPYLPKLTDDMIHAFEQDITSRDQAPVPKPSYSPRNSPKIDTIVQIVSQCLSTAKEAHIKKCRRWPPRVDATKEGVLSTFPKFLPLFREALKSLPILTDRLWIGIYCGAVNTFADEFVEDRLPEDVVSRLFPRTDDQKPDDRESLILSTKTSIVAAKSASKTQEECDIAKCRAMVEKVWIAGFHDSLLYLHQLVANHIGIALPDLLSSETEDGSKRH